MASIIARPSTPPSADLEEHIFRPLIPETDKFANDFLEVYVEAQYPTDSTAIFTLPQPTTFHELTHHISLYILATRHGYLDLCTVVLDQIRQYYTDTGFTASPFRLDYVYTHTNEPCDLRDFLVESAASRILSQARTQIAEGARRDNLGTEQEPESEEVATAAIETLNERRLSFEHTGSPTDLVSPSLLNPPATGPISTTETNTSPKPIILTSTNSPYQSHLDSSVILNHTPSPSVSSGSVSRPLAMYRHTDGLASEFNGIPYPFLPQPHPVKTIATLKAEDRRSSVTSITDSTTTDSLYTNPSVSHDMAFGGIGGHGLVLPEGAALTRSMQSLLKKGGDFAVDFASALIALDVQGLAKQQMEYELPSTSACPAGATIIVPPATIASPSIQVEASYPSNSDIYRTDSFPVMTV